MTSPTPIPSGTINEKLEEHEDEDHDDNQQQFFNNIIDDCESPWNIIIVNQIPGIVNKEKFLSIFSKYGKITDYYNYRELARITFETEEGARKVWKASQQSPIIYENNILAISLFSEDYCPIQNLPADCLIQIFLRLIDPRDKLALEDVSQSWKESSKLSWSNVTTTNYNGDDSIITRAKHHIRTVHMTLWEFEDTEALKGLARNCTNIEKLSADFNYYYDTNSSNEDDSNTLFVKELSSLLRLNKNLRHLSLNFREIGDIKLEFEGTISTELEYLKITQPRDYCEIFGSIVDLSIYRNLQVLIFKGEMRCAVSEVKGFENLVNLKTLGLNDYNLSHFLDIEKLKSLENLSLSGCRGTNKKLRKILQNNKNLKYVDIDWNEYVTDESFKYIQQLSQLNDLRMMDIRGISEEYFANMPTVRTLGASSCRITDTGLKRFLDTAIEIRQLDISDTNVTFECISIARDWTERTGKQLELFVSYEMIQQYRHSDMQKNDYKLTISHGALQDSDLFDW